MKSVIKKTLQSIKKSYLQYKNEKLMQKKQEKMLQLQNTANLVQLQLQYELGTILSQIQISTKLCNIKSHHALVPVGNYIFFDKYAYKFAITKSSDEVISTTILHTFKVKINHAINAHRQQLMYIYNTCDEIGKYELQQQFPLTFNGFHIITVTNELNDVVLEVVLRS